MNPSPSPPSGDSSSLAHWHHLHYRALSPPPGTQQLILWPLSAVFIFDSLQIDYELCGKYCITKSSRERAEISDCVVALLLFLVPLSPSPHLNMTLWKRHCWSRPTLSQRAAVRLQCVRWVWSASDDPKKSLKQSKWQTWKDYLMGLQREVSCVGLIWTILR